MMSLEPSLAQEIVTRTMGILGCNVNVMNADGRIIASGQGERIGDTHEGALLVLSQARAVEIDDATSRRLQGVQPGLNLAEQLKLIPFQSLVGLTITVVSTILFGVFHWG